MLLYRHWAIMANSEKFLDIIALRKCEFHYTKSGYRFCTIIIVKVKGSNSVLMNQFDKNYKISLSMVNREYKVSFDKVYQARL